MEPRNRFRGVDSASLCSVPAGTTYRVVVPARQAGNRFLGSLTGLQIRAQFKTYFNPPAIMECRLCLSTQRPDGVYSTPASRRMEHPRVPRPICKLLRSPASICWNRLNRFLGFLKVYKFGLRSGCTLSQPEEWGGGGGGFFKKAPQ
jgi:hypothetical protein